MTKEEVLATYTKLQAQAQSNEETPVNTSGTVIIGDDIITDTVELNTPGTPSEEDYLFVIKVPAAGGKKEYVKYTVAELLASLGAEVTDAKDAVTEMKSDIIDIQADITQKVATIEGYPEQIEQKTEESIETIDTEKQSAVDTINTEEQSALSAIDSAKESALDAIGESDTEGARGQAVTSITEKVAAFDKKIAQDNSEWDAKVQANNISWDDKVQNDNVAFDTKVSEANTTIDEKVVEAANQTQTAIDKASEASASALAAALSEQNAKNSENISTQKAAEADKNASESLKNRNTAERFAKGTENGVAVTEGDGFQDNAKYYKDLSEAAKNTAEKKATEANQSKIDAENAKELAKKYANADEDTVVETIEGEDQYSSKHYMKKVEKTSETIVSELESKGNEIKEYLDNYRSRGFHCPIGDGVTTQYTITHNLGTTLIQPWIIATDPDAIIPFTRFTAVDENTISVVFEWTPPADQMILCISTIKEIVESAGVPTGKIQWSQIENVKITEDQLDPSLMMTVEEANQILNS